MHNQVTMAEDPGEAVRALPVTVVPGMNHYEVASGSEPPTFVAANDLRPEIDEAAAHGAIANDTVAFISAVLGLADWSALEARVASSADFVQPIVSALEMEGAAPKKEEARGGRRLRLTGGREVRKEGGRHSGGTLL